MKLQNKKTFYLIIVSIVVISVISAGFIVTCTEVNHEYPCYGFQGEDLLEELEENFNFSALFIQFAHGSVFNVQYHVCDNEGDETVKWTDTRCQNLWSILV